eukprot:TRINITY_DN74_c0_g1_i1.p1 TRINITY_DN74_c0_g1~~TRINITY_DN74_c0_g1_i1.p1  ORF type:complete len:1068 (-),score=283.68 TRINITY_DN74_c0_g1_i1:40-3042(-)
MNGIIHPCSHPEHKPAPKSDDEIMVAIFEYIDRIFSIVRPRRVIYMAIDGVAPRAKMNQQRSRRFRSAKDAEAKDMIESQIKDDLVKSGLATEEEVTSESYWDSNQITPGTPFMKKISDSLKYYISDKITNDPGWRNVIVILSDANCPGEGEHKLMHFIRSQHSQIGYDANTRHCIHGLDADLIMLALASHEPYFSLLREDVLANERQDKVVLPKNASKAEIHMHSPYQFLQINVLREYLDRELKVNLPFGYDLERIVDDWVLLCFFVGNDFLPHLPTLEIRENAIETLMDIYKKNLPTLGGYLTENGHINLQRLPPIFRDLADLEDNILRERREKELNYARNNKKKRIQPVKGNEWMEPLRIDKLSEANEGVAVRLRAALAGTSVDVAPPRTKVSAKNLLKDEVKKRRDTQAEELGRKHEDPVRLGEEGWKERYYAAKFGGDKELLNNIKQSYLEGLEWVMQYYYQGCQSWQWYFPFHYAPFASEISECADNVIDFSAKTYPFKPFEQLLSVLPSSSSQFLPAPYANLMTDPESPIIDFYPKDFEIDLNGKKYEWQGVALLPFIDENRLFEAIKGLESQLTEEETLRNSRGWDCIFAHAHHPLGKQIINSINTQKDEEIDSFATKIYGSLSPITATVPTTVASPLPSLPDLENNMAVCAGYNLPSLPPDMLQFHSGLKPGLIMPPPVLTNQYSSRPFRLEGPAHRTTQFHLRQDHKHRFSRPYHPYDRNEEPRHHQDMGNRGRGNNHMERGRNPAYHRGDDPRQGAGGRYGQQNREPYRPENRGRPEQPPPQFPHMQPSATSPAYPFPPQNPPQPAFQSFQDLDVSSFGFAGGYDTESTTLSEIAKLSSAVNNNPPPETQAQASLKRGFNFKEYALGGSREKIRKMELPPPQTHKPPAPHYQQNVHPPHPHKNPQHKHPGPPPRLDNKPKNPQPPPQPNQHHQQQQNRQHQQQQYQQHHPHPQDQPPQQQHQQQHKQQQHQQQQHQQQKGNAGRGGKKT